MNTQELRNKVEMILPTDEPIPYQNSYLKIACLKTTLLAYVERIETSANCKEGVMRCYLERFNFLINDYQKQLNESKSN